MSDFGKLGHEDLAGPSSTERCRAWVRARSAMPRMSFPSPSSIPIAPLASKRPWPSAALSATSLCWTRYSATAPFWGGWRCAKPARWGNISRPGPRRWSMPPSCWRMPAAHADGEARAMADLRIAKRRAALAIAMADIAGVWDVNKVTAELTRFADGCVGGALRFLLRQEAERAGMEERDGAKLEQSAGLTVLAMGKYGAHELNYSSDIDLVTFYDAGKFLCKRGDMRGAAVDIVRGLVRLLAETTNDGYVFRTDLQAAARCRRRPRSPSPPMRRWITTKPWARTGNGPP